jgi:hypothetical protein
MRNVCSALCHTQDEIDFLSGAAREAQSQFLFAVALINKLASWCLKLPVTQP